MNKIFITRKIPEEAIKMLKERYKVHINREDRQLSKIEIIKRVKDIDAILPLLTDKIDKEVIAATKCLKVIANYAVGFDNIDIKEATRKGIIVTNTPGVLTEATADLAWSLLFATARRIAEGDRFMRDKKFKGWQPTLLLGYDIYGKTLGIIGTGRIGTAFALRSKGFNMRVLYFSRSKNILMEKKLKAKKVTLKKLLAESDFISLHLPLTKETHHLIEKTEIELMKKTAILVNTSRGEVLDEIALANALKNNIIAGAGLDVFEREPSITKKLLQLKNVTLTPHIGSATYQTRTKMAIMAAQSIIDVLEGKTPKNIVNK
ncbi:D-glycerate dehydrogenase [candidate division WOR-3 bacterium]|nr:D-glycerate dehydrogenase [candidate division WOR-3 bacterium]MCK4577081.1 D-glycerate dehydrogenase [candidate division WOR-3 bacterium]